MNAHSEDTETPSDNVKLSAHQENISLLQLATTVNAHLDTRPKRPIKHVLKTASLLDVQNQNSYKEENVLISVLQASGQTQPTEFVKDVQLAVTVV